MALVITGRLNETVAHGCVTFAQVSFVSGGNYASRAKWLVFWGRVSL